MGQSVERVIGIVFIQTARNNRRADDIISPDAVGVVIIAVFVVVDVRWCGRGVVLPFLVDNAIELVEAGESAGGAVSPHLPVIKIDIV